MLTPVLYRADVAFESPSSQGKVWVSSFGVVYMTRGAAGALSTAASNLTAERVPYLRVNSKKDPHDRGVELFPAPGFELRLRSLEGPCGAIRAVRCDGVERLGNRTNTCFQRNPVTLQASRVPRSVVAFVMRENDFGRVRQKWNLPKQLVAGIAVLSHAGRFLCRECAWFSQDCFRNAKHANVVKRGTAGNHVNLILGPTQSATDGDAERREPPEDQAVAGGYHRIFNRRSPQNRSPLLE
jgi:hypothetical protein